MLAISASTALSTDLHSTLPKRHRYTTTVSKWTKLYPFIPKSNNSQLVISILEGKRSTENTAIGFFHEVYLSIGWGFFTWPGPFQTL